MSEHICRNCRWWTPPDVGFDPHNPWGECLKSLEGDGRLSVGEDGRPVETQSDFGCVQWEEKE